MKIFSITLFFVIVGFLIFRGMIGGNLNSSVTNDYMQRAQDKVAEDAVAQFRMTLKGGDIVEICVQLGFVIEAYKQAQNEKMYLEYKKMEKDTCKKHGY